MLTSRDILSFNFYNYGEPFTGSLSGRRYRIKQEKEETGRDENDKPVYRKYFDVAVWPEPLSYEATDAALIEHTEYPFTEDGYEAVLEYLNAVLAS
ncbi:MAG: GNAT family acetyltransferase [Lachnospiraceae bacterium]|nr:GNAT family acetyltransferase [Lachnospiraceae bacterium]